MRKLIALAVLVELLAACQTLAGLFAPQSLKDLPQLDVGARASTVTESGLQQIKGETLEPLPHRDLHRGTWESVLPIGAELEVKGIDAPGVDLGHSTAYLSPWIYVRVRSSKIAKQRGWEGWVHKATLSAAHKPSLAAPTATLHTAHPTHLCKVADGGVGFCNVQLEGGALVYVLERGATDSLVETWSERTGLYAVGYVANHQLVGGL